MQRTQRRKACECRHANPVDHEREEEDPAETERHREHRGEDRAHHREEAVHRPGPGYVLLAMRRQRGDATQSEGHEGTETQAEGGEAGEGEKRTERQRRSDEELHEPADAELVEEG